MPEIPGSILETIKKMLGIPYTDTAFDTDIMANINSVFMILHQLGVGPEEVFSIEDNTVTWEDFIEDISVYHSVKTYIYLKVKQVFDPAPTSFVLDAMSKQISELEWRLMVKADPPLPPEPEPEE